MTQIDRSKRFLLKGSLFGAGALALSSLASVSLPSVAKAASLSQATRDAMTPDQVIEFLKLGNQRFLSNKPLNHDYRAQKRSSQFGQYPAAIILSCIDSRAPAEIILDAGIGDLFNSRVAGNVLSDDVLGSMEFACAVAGAKVILVLGHTKCGAVKGAIANVELEHLTGLLEKIKPVIKQTTYIGKRSPENYDFVDAVAKVNVVTTAKSITEKSKTLNTLVQKGTIKIVPAMYDVSTGKVEFFV